MKRILNKRDLIDRYQKMRLNLNIKHGSTSFLKAKISRGLKMKIECARIKLKQI